MELFRAAQESEMDPKLIMERFRIVADNIQATTLCGSFRSECTDDHVATLFDSLRNLADISDTVIGYGKEMEDCSVVPYIVNRGLKVDSRDISNNPLHSIRERRQAFAICVDSGL